MGGGLGEMRPKTAPWIAYLEMWKEGEINLLNKRALVPRVSTMFSKQVSLKVVCVLWLPLASQKEVHHVERFWDSWAVGKSGHPRLEVAIGHRQAPTLVLPVDPGLQVVKASHRARSLGAHWEIWGVSRFGLVGFVAVWGIGRLGLAG